MSKIEMKINRYIKHIGKDDLIVDNGSCIQITTQTGAWGEYNYAPLIMSKKLFKQLKYCAFIFVDKEKTNKANAQYAKPFLTYYRFDIDRMIRSGDYQVVEDKANKS